MLPDNESERLTALQRYRILDTPPDGAFDRVTALAARLFKVPVAIVSLVDHDRIWFKSRHGLDIEQIEREPGLCASAILSDDVYAVTNANEDPRTLANPLVAGAFGLRFYAACPLHTHDGYNLGTLCVIDKQPRALADGEAELLRTLAAIVMDAMELRMAARNLVDTTEALRKQEEMLQQSQKLEAMGRLAGGVAHEFNNLLAPMLTQTSVIEQCYGHDPQLRRWIRPIKMAIEQASALNQRLLAVGRKVAEAPVEVTLNAVANETVDLLRHTIDRRIQLRLALDEGLAPLHLVRTQLSQVIINLILNARDSLLEKQLEFKHADFIPEIGIATCRHEHRAAPGARTAASGCYQRLSVSDNGNGMSEETAKRAFEPFFTTKRVGKGTGLGLSMVWNIMQSMGGWVDMESEVGKGTVFHLFVPERVNGEASFAHPLPSELPVDGRAMHILYAEDNELVFETTREVLEACGHQITHAPDGVMAWEKFRQSPQTFDLLLTDLNMPKLSGLDFISLVRSLGSAVKVVALSGYLSPEEHERLSALQVDGILTKPILPDVLTSHIARLA